MPDDTPGQAIDNAVIDERPLPADPPYVGDERTILVQFLDYYRAVFVRKASGLTQAQLAARTAASTLTLGGLLKHMALVEDHWFNDTWAGEDEVEPWASVDWTASPDWELDSAASDDPLALLALYDAAVGRSRAAIARDLDLDGVATRPHRGQPVTRRWILVHMIEEYARHCGHADLLRESIDGRTGD